VLDCSAIPDLEYTALKRLVEAEAKLQQSGVTLWLAGLNPEPLQLVQKSALGKTLGRSRMYFNLEQAVESYQKGSHSQPPLEPDSSSRADSTAC
jgi:sulfate permease, SulP family